MDIFLDIKTFTTGLSSPAPPARPNSSGRATTHFTARDPHLCVRRCSHLRRTRSRRNCQPACQAWLGVRVPDSYEDVACLAVTFP
eukprot:360786-Chlamydomonas_euryale.AAC.4